MAYMEIPNNKNFSDKYPTWIIAYCPDTDSFFVTNERYVFWEYEKQFGFEREGIDYFREHIDEFKNIRSQIAEDIGGISKDGVLYLENTEERW